MDFERQPADVQEKEPITLLFIEPSQEKSKKPLIDDTTKKIAAAFAHAEEWGSRWRGLHKCSCGARSTNSNYKLPNGMVTNALAVHYVALHRKEVPQDMIEIINGFTEGALDPTKEMIDGR